MSHVVAIQLQVKDLDALERAAKVLGALLVRGQTTFRWYGRWMNDYSADNAAYKNGVQPQDYGKCDHAVTHPRCNYDIGLVRQLDGTFIVVADEWSAGGLVAVFGKSMSKLKQGYGVEVAKKAMKKSGFRVKETMDKLGNPRLVCTRA